MAVRTKETPPAAPVEQFRFPRQGEWTYAHWLKFPDDGWKYEIIDGVLDYQAKTVEVFTLAEGVYNLTGAYSGNDVVASAQLTDFQITVNSLFNF